MSQQRRIAECRARACTHHSALVADEAGACQHAPYDGLWGGLLTVPRRSHTRAGRETRPQRQCPPYDLAARNAGACQHAPYDGLWGGLLTVPHRSHTRAGQETRPQRACQHAPYGHRRGISLVEVLISMFVLSIGLLGLASLIPVGRFEITSASNADRSSTAFRAAFRETKVRRILNPLMWLDVDNLAGAATQPWYDVNDPNYPGMPLSAQLVNGPIDGGQSVCIDPWFIMNNYTTADPLRLRCFPIPIDNDPDPTNDRALLNPPRMNRVSLRSWLGPTVQTMPLGIADRVFTWQDDVVFSLPDNEEFRPQLQYDWADLNGDGIPDTPMRRQVAGQYTWLVTITPATAQLVPMPGGSISGGPTPMVAAQYTVSVAVFYRREANADAATSFDIADRQGRPPTERMVYADFIYGSGLGGGTVRLRLPATQVPSDPTDPDESDIPRLRPNRWLMLCGWVEDNSGATTLLRPVFKWYRVAAVGDGPLYDDQNDEWVQDVTLDGPDWYVNDDYTGTNTGSEIKTFIDADSTSAGLSTDYTVWAALFDGVIAVGQKTMPLESWNMWSP